jgi:hypothetical protein
LLKNRIIEFFHYSTTPLLHYSITPVLQYSKELSKGKEPYEAPFQGAKAKSGPLGLDSLLLDTKILKFWGNFSDRKNI